MLELHDAFWALGNRGCSKLGMEDNEDRSGGRLTVCDRAIV